MPTHLSAQALTTALLLAAAMLSSAVVDMRSFRIPNLITYPSMLLFLALGLLWNGSSGLLHSFTGLLLAGGCMLPPFLLGVMGAGDVKLVAVTGAALGPDAVLTVLLFTSLAGGLQAVVTVAIHTLMAPSGASKPKVCYGVAIAVGSLCTLAWHMAGKEYITLF